MKNKIDLILLLYSIRVLAQEHETSQHQQLHLENLAANIESENEDDDFLQQLDFFRKHPIDLNSVEEDELKLLMVLTDQQILNFSHYRKLLGKIIDVYELQAVPGWDIATIKKLTPFVSLHDQVLLSGFIKRFKQGEHSVLLRTSGILEKSKAYLDRDDGYAGSRHRLLFRYKFRCQNLLQYGLTGEKDPGEQFFKGAQRSGFDFYSFHLFIRKMGVVKSLVIGDFTISMGQGLIQWQSMAFKKGTDAVAVKRQSPVLKPYSSSGEFNFFRGVGCTMQQNKWQITVAGSYRKVDANRIEDTVDNAETVSSMIESGLHRTKAEKENKNQLTLASGVVNLFYRSRKIGMGLNGIFHSFSVPFEKNDEPYNYFAAKGVRSGNISVDYSYNFRNMHFFGEAAINMQRSKALLCGMLMSAHEKADLAFMYRSIEKGYCTLFGNAFTENFDPVNEKGFYAGITLKPVHALRVDAYADFFLFPWLKYRVDAPSNGKEYMISLDYKPNKKIDLYCRYRYEAKKRNGNADSILRGLVTVIKKNYRLHLLYQITQNTGVEARSEILWYNTEKSFQQQGFLVFAEVISRLSSKNLRAGIRLQYFETGGYETRIYSYEKSLLFDYSVPALYDTGFRYYLNIHFNLDKIARMLSGRRLQADVWCRFAQTIYTGKQMIGSGDDAMVGNRKSELKFQLTIKFGA